MDLEAERYEMEESRPTEIFFLRPEEQFAPIRIVLGRRDRKLEKLGFSTKKWKKRKRVFLVPATPPSDPNYPHRWSSVGSSFPTSLNQIAVHVD